MKSRNKQQKRGASAIEYLVVLATVGLTTAGALVVAGGDLYREFLKDQEALSSPVP
jgi:hypothetical protein